MKIDHIVRESMLVEANIAAKIKDPRTIKMLAIAMRHDSTLPKNKIAALGTKPTEDDYVKLWSELLDRSLSNTSFGDISRDGKFDEWLTRLYINGIVDYEDVSGEAGDALSAWKALSIRGLLEPQYQDFNRFSNLAQIQKITQNRKYSDELRRIRNDAEIQRHKKEKKEIVLVDSDRFLVVMPLNYGSCYTFNNAAGFSASFCTGSSSGQRWFDKYAPDGPLISVFDKQNPDEVNGKWQIHAPTDQINNGNQSIRSDDTFAKLFPGLMAEIVKGIRANASEIQEASFDIVNGGYDVENVINDLAKAFPESFNSKPKDKNNDLLDL